ncbi:MAG: M55 family metallopeptidase [Gemmatimonadetes bacterium]|nr:M55 family metallopeptidase [Gemmatimonadota bacterium]
MSGRPIAFGCALALLAVAALSPRAAQAQRALKVYISVDMEGITGVVSSDQLGPTSFEYQRAREWMTGEALAAIQGARDAGATEIVVSDSHGNGENLLIDQFPDDITIVRSWPRPNMMMEGSTRRSPRRSSSATTRERRT